MAVEDELVLAADQVAEGEVGTVGACPFGEHRFPLAALAAVVRRTRGVGDQARARRGLDRGRRARRPDVLADRQSDAAARRPRSWRAPRRGRSSAARRRPSSWAGGSCGRSPRTSPSARTARELCAWRRSPRTGDRLGEADQGHGLARPQRPAPRPPSCRPRRSAASGRGPRPGSRGCRAPERRSARRPRPRRARSTRRPWPRCRRCRRRWGRSGPGLRASRCPREGHD